MPPRRFENYVFSLDAPSGNPNLPETDNTAAASSTGGFAVQGSRAATRYQRRFSTTRMPWEQSVIDFQAADPTHDAPPNILGLYNMDPPSGQGRIQEHGDIEMGPALTEHGGHSAMLSIGYSLSQIY